MKPSFLPGIVVALGAALGCGGVSANIPDEGGADGATNGDGGGTDGNMAKDGLASTCAAPSVALSFGSCPPPPTCGGAIAAGTYFYTAGCVPDPWAQAKQYCNTLQVSEQAGTVKGCIAFTGSTASRDVAASYSAKLTYPTACLLGASCTTLEGYLKPYFTQASCAPGVTGCVCSVASNTASIATVGYSLQANQVVTSTNGRYDYCVSGSTLGMRYVSGPSPEPGIYQLTKQ